MSEKNKTMVLNTNLIRESDWLSSEDLVLTLAHRSGAECVNSSGDVWAMVFNIKKIPNWWHLKKTIHEITRERIYVLHSYKEDDLAVMILKVSDPRKSKPTKHGFRLKFRKSGRITLTDRDSGYHFGPESPEKVIDEIKRLTAEGYVIEDASRLLARIERRTT